MKHDKVQYSTYLYITLEPQWGSFHLQPSHLDRWFEKVYNLCICTSGHWLPGLEVAVLIFELTYKRRFPVQMDPVLFLYKRVRVIFGSQWQEVPAL